MSGFILLLPFIEQTGLYGQLNLTLPFSDVIWDNAGAIRNRRGNHSGPPWNGQTGGGTKTPTVNQRLMDTKLALFVCPSDGGPRDSTAQRHPNRYGVNGNPALTGQRTNYDFIAVAGSDFNTCNWWRTQGPATRYMFGENSETRLSDIKDGTTNTFMFGETTVEPRCNGWGPTWGYRAWVMTGLDPGQGRATSGAYYRPPTTTPPFAGSGPGINDWTLIASWTTNCNPTTGTGNGVPRPGRLGDWGRVGSTHPGGANFAMGDGSVRYVKETVQWPVLMQWSRIGDGAVQGSLD